MNEIHSLHNSSPNRYDYLNFSTDNVRINKANQRNQNEEMLKLQKEKIKDLKRTIKGYQKNSEAQNAKLSSHDSLIIELNSINRNYAQLEHELNQFRAESFRLNEIIQSKNNIIGEFQRLIDLSTTKFEIFEETNNALKLTIEECETKLQSLPNIINENNSLKDKISSYETKIETITSDNSKLESVLKAKMSTLEKSKNAIIRQNEEDMQELRVAIERLKIENEKYKKMAQEANLTLIDKENAFKIKIEDKERDYDKLSKRLSKLQQELKEIELNYKDKMTIAKDTNIKLEKDIKAMAFELKGRNNEIQRLNNAIFDYSNAIGDFEQELKSSRTLITNLTEEKEKLMKQLNDKQTDFVDYQNSSQQEIDILHRKVILIDKERVNLIKENEALKKELINSKQKIDIYETYSKKHLKECLDVDGKYNELVRAFELKDKEQESDYQEYTSMVMRNQNEFDLLKAKYEKKIQMLKETNEELETKVKNLINSLVYLKEYSISIEKNMNDNMNMNMNMNMSMNNSAFANNNLNLSNANYSNAKDNNNQNSKQVIKALKEVIGKIDSKIMSAKGNNSTIDNSDSNNTYQFDSRYCYEN